MLDFLRDQVWQFVGAAVGLLALCVSAVLYLLQRRRKALTYDVISSISLTGRVEEWGGDLQIVFGGQQVRHVYLLLVRFTNSGNQPIESDDYERPLNLSVEAPSRVLTVQVAETNPSNLLPDLLPDGAGGWRDEIPPELALDSELRTVPFRSVLLNPGDSFTIKMLVSQFTPGRLGIDARIVGVKSISMAKEDRVRHLLRQWMWLPLSIVFAILVNLAESPQFFRRYIAIIGFVLFMVWVAIYTWRDVRTVWKSIQHEE
jgi:hypothetical protein